MSASLFRREIFPFLLSFVGLIVAAIGVDGILHWSGLAWIGRYIGIGGSLLILTSFLYSLRKRSVIRFGDPGRMLAAHELLAWSGSLLILIHAGIHFNAVLPWLALGAMVVNIGSGLTGKFLLGRSRRDLASSKAALRQRGLAEEEIGQALFWQTVAVDAMKKWRSVHLPITLVFAVLAIGHMVSIFLFWQWQWQW